jgi:hypothetical protein
MMRFTALPWAGMDGDPPDLAERGAFIRHAPALT